MLPNDPAADARDDEEWDDWVLVELEEWWRTPASTAPWQYRRDREWTEAGLRLPFHPRPPYVSDTDDVPISGEGLEEVTEDLRLSALLPGVQVAEDVVRRYEVDAGVALPHDPVWDLVQASKTLCIAAVDEVVVEASQKQWRDNAERLLGGILEPLPYDPLDPRNWDQDLTGSPSTATDSTRPRTPVDVIDLTLSVSDMSMESDLMPRTPQIDKKSYAAAVFDDVGHVGSSHSFVGGTVVSPSPSKPLSASALSFVPTFNLDPTPSSPTQDSYVSATYEFHFPSLHAQPTTRPGARSLPPSLERDEHGFYTEVATSGSPIPHTPSSTRSATPKRQSAALLPAFLADASSTARTRHTSKTREMVDRLRSSNSGLRRHRRSKDAEASEASKETLVTTADGWITGVEVEQTEPVDRSESPTPERPKEDWVASLFQGKSTPPKASKAKAAATATANPTSHRRAPTSANASPSSAGLHSPASSITSFGLPPTPASAHFPPPPQPYYGYHPAAYPPYPYPPPPAPYIMPPWQMQMQMQPTYPPPGYMMPPPPPPMPKPMTASR